MGCYDILVANCPVCNNVIDEQTKWIQDWDLRWFNVGQKVEGAPPLCVSVELDGCYECKHPLFANFEYTVFTGFTTVPTYTVHCSDKNRRDKEIKA